MPGLNQEGGCPFDDNVGPRAAESLRRQLPRKKRGAFNPGGLGEE